MTDKERLRLIALIASGVGVAVVLGGAGGGDVAPAGVSVGVWLQSPALLDPDGTAGALAELGVSTVNIMLNDFSRARDPSTFRTHDVLKLGRMAEAAHDAGMSVDLTTWVMPHAGFIEGLAKLRNLRSALGAHRIWLDAEEPWVRARNPMGYHAAADAIAQGLHGVPLVLSGIPFANAKLGSLAAVCGTWSPQCYATTRPQSMKPGSAAEVGVKQWRQRFGEPADGWVIGLAGYMQPANAGSMMGPALDGAAKTGAREVCYWSSSQILKTSSVQSFIRKATA